MWDFNQKYGSVKVFEKIFYADLAKKSKHKKYTNQNTNTLQQITLTYVDYTK